MKVYIGPYISRWRSNIHGNIHEHWLVWHHKVDYGWRVKEEDYDRLDKAVEWLEDKLQDLYNLTINKYLDRKQRKIKVKVDYYDIWSADHTIALLVHPILLKLKENKHGAPFVDDEDVPEELRSTSAAPKANEWDTDSNHFKRWDYVLDEMIWAFEQCTREDHGTDQFYSGEVDWKFDKDENTGLYKIGTGPKNTFKVDSEGKIAHYNRIKNGTRLFGKYYMALWD